MTKSIKIEFDYLDTYGGHGLKTRSDDGLEIEIYFKGLDAETISISGHEMNVNSDDYKGLYVLFGEIVPVSKVIEEANKQIEDIVNEYLQEIADDEAMERELSSPYYQN